MAALAATVGAVVIAAAGTASVRTPSAQCLQVRPAALMSIRSGLHRAARPKLRSARAVKAKGDFSHAPRGYAHGVYFVSAKLRGTGVATWAVSTSFMTNGCGLIYAVSRTARAVSEFGADVPLSVMARWGISSRTHGFAESRSCVT